MERRPCANDAHQLSIEISTTQHNKSFYPFKKEKRTSLRTSGRMRAPKDDKDQKLVVTPYGKGLVVRSRQNGTGVKEIELIDWNESTRKVSAHLIGSSSSSSNNKQKRSNMLYSLTNFPSIKPEIGSDVITTFGRGKVIELRDDDDVIVVRLSSWRLAGRSNVICHFFIIISRSIDSCC